MRWVQRTSGAPTVAAAALNQDSPSMSRIAALASCLLLVAACSSTRARAPEPAAAARHQAADQPGGCGAAPEIRGRHCPHAGKLTSDRSGVGGGARAAKTGITEDAAETRSEGVTGRSTFPRDDARTALRAAEGGLRSCNDSAVPRTLHVAMRFEPSGKVSTVEVSPADGRVASCVQSRLREVAITPFEGRPVTMRVPVTL